MNILEEIVEHVTGNGLGGDVHIAAINKMETEMCINTADASRLRNLLTCALTIIKMKAAGQQMENCISTLASCGVDVGKLGHSRYALAKNIHTLIYYLNCQQVM